VPITLPPFYSCSTDVGFRCRCTSRSGDFTFPHPTIPTPCVIGSRFMVDSGARYYHTLHFLPGPTYRYRYPTFITLHLGTRSTDVPFVERYDTLCQRFAARGWTFRAPYPLLPHRTDIRCHLHAFGFERERAFTVHHPHTRCWCLIIRCTTQ